MQLLLVDNRVKDVQTVTQSLLSGVDIVSIDFENDTYETLIAKIPVKTYESVGIFQENYELNDYQLIQSFKDSVLTNVKAQDPTLDTWSQYKSLLSYFKNTLQIQTLDLMGCNIHSSLDWNYVIDYLGKQFQININSSNDNTGSPDFGGNWILESGNQDLVGKYFSNNIDKYQFTLGPVTLSSYVITTDNKLYGAGGSSSSGTMKDTDRNQSANFISVPNVTNISSLLVGSKANSSFVIKSDGSVWATGSNSSSQLGTGNTASVSVFTNVYTPSEDATKCIAVSCGAYHSLILLKNGSVLATGSNSFGQLGTGNTTDVSVFTNVYTPSEDATKCIAVSCGGVHSDILLKDGSVLATGYNSFGQLGIGNTTDSNVFRIAYNPNLQVNNGVKCIAVSSSSHTQILLEDGSVWATGYNSSGQLGIGNTTNSSIFKKAYTPSGTTKCTAVSSGGSHSHILLSDGSVRATGYNSSGQLGIGNTTDSNVFTTVYTPTSDTTKCIAVSSGGNHTQILLSNGSVLATGINTNGQLGNGTLTNVNVFTNVYTPSGGKQCIAVYCGVSHTIILLSDGSINVTGQNTYDQMGFSRGVYNKLTYLDIDVQSVSSGYFYIAVIKSDGSLWTKGLNNKGQLGTGNTTDVRVFTKVYDPTLLANNGVKCIAVSCGDNHTQLLLSDGSVLATGFNDVGKLGTGNTTDVSVFTKVYDPKLLVNKGVKCIAVSCGSDHSQILLSDGSVLVTGLNTDGRLGTGTLTAVSVFTKVYDPNLLVNNGVKCIAVSCGRFHTQLLLSDGSVRATGLNADGQLGSGNPTTTNFSVFTPVYTPTSDTTKCIAVSCGRSYTQIVLSDGSVLATGNNSYGQLGSGNTTSLSVFTKVYDPTLLANNGVKCTAVSCGLYHTQILLSNGYVIATGYNGYQQLATGNATQQNSFTPMLKSDGTNMANVLLLSEMFPSTIPAAPTIASVNANSLTRVDPTITISVANPSDTTITNYSWSTDGINYTVLSPAQTTSPLTISATGLTVGSTYTFKIKAINDVGTSDPSTGVSATFTIPPPPPAAPTISSINGASQDGKISISFTQSPSDSTITNYSWSTNGTNYTVLNPSQTTSPLTIPVNGLNSGSEYTFTIKAINAGGSSDASTGISSAVTIPLSVPVITNVSHVNGSINIYYTQSLLQETGVTSIKYSTNNGETYTSTNVTTSPLKITGLKPKTHYQFILKANNGSDSDPSNTYGLTYYIKVGSNQ